MIQQITGLQTGRVLNIITGRRPWAKQTSCFSMITALITCYKILKVNVMKSILKTYFV